MNRVVALLALGACAPKSAPAPQPVPPRAAAPESRSASDVAAPDGVILDASVKTSANDSAFIKFGADMQAPTHDGPAVPKTFDPFVKAKNVGRFVYRVFINTDGTIAKCATIRSLDGFDDDAVCREVSAWHWTPAKRDDGTPVAVSMSITFNFKH